MAQMEELLQELIDLKKEEMRRAKNARILHFIFSTLPLTLILLFSVWGSWVLYESMQEAIQNPSLFQQFTGF